MQSPGVVEGEVEPDSTLWCYCCQQEVSRHITDGLTTVVWGSLLEHMARCVWCVFLIQWPVMCLAKCLNPVILQSISPQEHSAFLVAQWSRQETDAELSSLRGRIQEVRVWITGLCCRTRNFSFVCKPCVGGVCIKYAGLNCCKSHRYKELVGTALEDLATSRELKLSQVCNIPSYIHFSLQFHDQYLVEFIALTYFLLFSPNSCMQHVCCVCLHNCI